MDSSVLLTSRSLPKSFLVFISFFLCVYVREKFTLEQDIGDTEEAIRQKSAEVQVRAALPQWLAYGLNPELTLGWLDRRCKTTWTERQPPCRNWSLRNRMLRTVWRKWTSRSINWRTCWMKYGSSARRSLRWWLKGEVRGETVQQSPFPTHTHHTDLYKSQNAPVFKRLFDHLAMVDIVVGERVRTRRL